MSWSAGAGRVGLSDVLGWLLLLAHTQALGEAIKQSDTY